MTCKTTHDEQSIREALEQMRSLITELTTYARLEVEVVHDDTDWLGLTFVGTASDGGNVRSEVMRLAE